MIHLLRSLFVDFYCLPIHEVLILLGVGTWYFRKLHTRFGHHFIWKITVFVITVAWVTVITYSTVTGRNTSQGIALNLIPFHSYRKVLNGGNPEFLRSNFMNVVLFFPAGLLLASLLPEKWSWVKLIVVFALFAAISAAVEYAQYRFDLGWAEIDDVIHNTLGALIGCGCSFISIPPTLKLTQTEIHNRR